MPLVGGIFLYHCLTIMSLYLFPFAMCFFVVYALSSLTEDRARNRSCGLLIQTTAASQRELMITSRQRSLLTEHSGCHTLPFSFRVAELSMHMEPTRMNLPALLAST